MAILRPYLHSPGGSLLPPTPGPFRGPRGARLAPKRRRGEPASPMAIAIASPPSSRTDTGILAQQSDVRCKRGRLGVILRAPVAYLPHRGASEQLIEPTAFATGALYY